MQRGADDLARMGGTVLSRSLWATVVSVAGDGEPLGDCSGR